MGKTYALAQVLELKKQIENQRMLEVARIEHERQQQLSRIESLLTVMEEQLAVKLPVEFIEHRSRFITAQTTRVHTAQSKLCDIATAREEAQKHLLTAAIDRKKFELHRDRFLTEARKMELDVEQAQGDESATQVYLRQKETNDED